MLRDHGGAQLHECRGGSGELCETFYERLTIERDDGIAIRQDPRPIDLVCWRHPDSVATFFGTIKGAGRGRCACVTIPRRTNKDDQRIQR